MEPPARLAVATREWVALTATVAPFAGETSATTGSVGPAPPPPPPGAVTVTDTEADVACVPTLSVATAVSV